MKVVLCRRFHFEAAHRNLSAPAGAMAARLHGHSYIATVDVAGPVDENAGWLIDFADFKSACAPIIAQLDHRMLNDVEGMRDTSREDIQRWLVERLAIAVPGFAGCTVDVEGDVAFAPLVGHIGTAVEPRERMEFGFAAAHFLPQLPADHRCRRLHGHSFRVVIDTRDSQSTVARLSELYEQLDHQLLNDVPGLENPTAEHLARWLWKSLDARRAPIEKLMIRETCTTTCIYRGE